MQEIKFEDGTTEKEFFKSFNEATDDAKEKNVVRPIKSLKITMVDPKSLIPSKKRK